MLISQQNAWQHTRSGRCTQSHAVRDILSLPFTQVILTGTGDIGYVPQEVEQNMEKHFKLAHKWGCVLILDEADVFLAKRNVSSTS